MAYIEEVTLHVEQFLVWFSVWKYVKSGSQAVYLAIGTKNCKI